MTKHERITIGITCYNAQDTIQRALNSALAQDWPNKEIVIVDDASTDQSVRMIKAGSASHDDARHDDARHDDARLIIHKSNKGPAGARQTIIDAAEGAFIVFFDDDDESLPNRVRVQYEQLCRYEQSSGSSLIACYASGKRVYPNGYTLDMQAIGSKLAIPFGTDVADRLLFYGGDPRFFMGSGTPTSALMARRSTMVDVGGFDASFRRVEDVDFAIRLALMGGHFIGCAETLFIQYATDAVDKSPEKNRDAEVQLAEKHRDYLITKNRYIYAKKWPLLRYYHFKKRYGQFALILTSLVLRYPLKTLSHFLRTAPKRFLHERNMKERKSP